MKIAVASDHGGFAYKQILKEYLQSKGHEICDFGTDCTDSCDYPDFALPAAEAVANGECGIGILVCSTGIGISIAANKVPGIRCAHCHDTYSAKYTRLHNNANMLAFGQKVIGEGLMLEIVDVFMSTEFEGGRHQRRIDKISDIEKKYVKNINKINKN